LNNPFKGYAQRFVRVGVIHRKEMPRQNRVTPFGTIIVTPARGTLMGNRGCLHNHHQQIIRLYQGKRWIICQLQFKERRRKIMTSGHYTELFFLDEATALAAGHRPCAECSRPRFEKFRAFWMQANPDPVHKSKPLATEIDDVLHRERINAAQHKTSYQKKLGTLPDGSFVALDAKQPYLLFRGFLLAWRPEGYGQCLAPPSDRIVQVLTPRSIVRTLAAGYRAGVHPSAVGKKLEA
jgi:hypothetical protein